MSDSIDATSGDNRDHTHPAEAHARRNGADRTRTDCDAAEANAAETQDEEERAAASLALQEAIGKKDLADAAARAAYDAAVSAALSVCQKAEDMARDANDEKDASRHELERVTANASETSEKLKKAQERESAMADRLALAQKEHNQALAEVKQHDDDDKEAAKVRDNKKAEFEKAVSAWEAAEAARVKAEIDHDVAKNTARSKFNLKRATAAKELAQAEADYCKTLADIKCRAQCRSPDEN